MKLVELLARELDVWPEQAECATQEGGGCAYFWKSYRLSYVRGDWVHGSGYGLISEDWSHSLSELAVDHATAIITRADWQAERERIAGGWIAHDGGECPVDVGSAIDLRLRCGEELLTASRPAGEWNWPYSKCGTDRQITEYRLHKPEQASAEAIDAGIAAADAGQVKPIEEVKAMHEYNPIHTRNRILEIDRTTEALEEERVQLVQRLADEGFVLARVDGKVAPETVGNLPRDQWRIGDLVVRVEATDESSMPLNTPLPITYFDGSGYGQDVNVDSDYYPKVSGLRWHSRPTA